MLESRQISVEIERPWQELYEAIWRPQDFLRWASGLRASGLYPVDADWWQTSGPTGPVRLRFSPHNDFGVMDHWVIPGDGPEVYVPMRIVANGDGAQVNFTLFRQPGMSEEAFRSDAEWVMRDLQVLKKLAESL